MNNRNNRSNRNHRATGAIVASVSLLVIIVLAVPWVDEYLRLRGDEAKLTELENRFAELRQRNKQLDLIDSKLTSRLKDLSDRSIDPLKTEHVREAIVEIVRQTAGRVRRLEIPTGESRIWATKDDQIQNSTMPIYGEESDFELHTHTVELQVDGSLQSIQTILRRITDQGWLMTTTELTLAPTLVRESPVTLELQLVLYGLVPHQREQPEEFAYRPFGSSIR